MSEQNVQAISRLYDAFNRGDRDTFDRAVSRDLQWNEAESSLYGRGNPYLGFAAVRDEVFAPTLRDFDQFRVDLEKLIDAGDYVIGSGRYRGRSRATGKDLSAQFCHVMHLDTDGKLDRVQEYTDTLQEAQVTGRTTQIVEEIQILEPAI